MSDTEHEIEDTEDGPQGLRQHTKKLEAKVTEAESRAAAAERELAFAKAGLPLNDPKMTYFVKGYDGDLTPEAIKTAAEAAGFIGEPEPSIPTEELAQHQQAANLSAGGGSEPAWTGALHDNPQYQQEMAQAMTPEAAMAVMTKYGSPMTDPLD